MPLHPVIASALQSAADAPPYSAIPIEQARALAKRGYPPRTQRVPVAGVSDREIPGPAGSTAIRIYEPPGTGPHPAIVFFHGSGFVLLDLDTHDDICRRICAGSSSAVFSVDYRLAPENKFPAAPDDCLSATRWVAEHAGEYNVDPSRIALAGDSAGGCLAAVTALRIRDEGGPALAGLLLWYPVTDFPSTPTSTYSTFGIGYGLTDERVRWYWEQYITEDTDVAHCHVSPLRMPDPRGLPSTYVGVAEFDVLRDEGEAFARRMGEAGIDAVTRRWNSLNHGFLKYAGVISEVDAAVSDACEWLTRKLSTTSSTSLA